MTFDIGVDIDDVLHPWYATAHELCVAAGITNGATPTGWAPHESYGVDIDTWADVLSEATLNGGLYDVPPIPGAVESLRRMMFSGHRIHLVTARGFMTHGYLIRKHTVDWLEEFAVPHQTLTFTKDKVSVANELDLDYFIDDGVHNFQALEIEAPDTKTYLLTAPHNRDFYTPFRLETMNEFAELVCDAAEGLE
jgi:5'(3')-deoxyribonucleotidase